MPAIVMHMRHSKPNDGFAMIKGSALTCLMTEASIIHCFCPIDILVWKLLARHKDAWTEFYPAIQADRDPRKNIGVNLK